MWKGQRLCRSLGEYWIPGPNTPQMEFSGPRKPETNSAGALFPNHEVLPKSGPEVLASRSTLCSISSIS